MAKTPKVDKMIDNRSQTQSPDASRKTRLSPDLAEFLNVLNALDARSAVSSKPN